MQEWWTGRARAAVPTTIRPTAGPDPAGEVSPSGARSHRSRRRRALASLAAALVVAGALAPAAIAQQEVSLTTPYPAVAVAPGTSVDFPIEVTVTEVGRVDLSVSGAPTGWETSLRGGGFVVDGVLATPDDPTGVTLNVSVPLNAADGVTTITVTGSGGGSTAELDLDVRVTETAAGELTLGTDTADLRGTASQTFSFSLSLDNSTAEDLTFSTIAQGPPGWTVTASIQGQTQAASALLEAGATQNIDVSVDPPDTTPAGLYPIGVQVTAGERTVTAQLSVDITGNFGLTLSTEDQRLNATGSAGTPFTVNLVVENTGSAQLDDVSLSARTPTDWTTTFEPETLGIAAGETAEVVATVTPSGDAIAGDYEMTITASGEDASDDVAIRVTVEASPLGIIIGLAILLVVVAGLWWVFRTYGRR